MFCYSDTALQFLDRMAGELGLPMKKIEVRGSVKKAVMITSLTFELGKISFPAFLVSQPLGLSRPSRVGNYMGRLEPHHEIRSAEFPHRCCACLSGMSLSQIKAYC